MGETWVLLEVLEEAALGVLILEVFASLLVREPVDALRRPFEPLLSEGSVCCLTTPSSETDLFANKGVLLVAFGEAAA